MTKHALIKTRSINYYNTLRLSSNRSRNTLRPILHSAIPWLDPRCYQEVGRSAYIVHTQEHPYLCRIDEVWSSKITLEEPFKNNLPCCLRLHFGLELSANNYRCQYYSLIPASCRGDHSGPDSSEGGDPDGGEGHMMICLHSAMTHTIRRRGDRCGWRWPGEPETHADSDEEEVECEHGVERPGEDRPVVQPAPSEHDARHLARTARSESDIYPAAINK
jgi:hypothetical protein